MLSLFPFCFKIEAEILTALPNSPLFGPIKMHLLNNGVIRRYFKNSLSRDNILSMQQLTLKFADGT